MSDSDSSLSSVEPVASNKRKKLSVSRAKSKKSRKAKAGPSLFEDEVEEASEDESDLDQEAGYETTVKEISRHEHETNLRYEERRRAQEAFEQMSEKDIARRLEEKHDKIRSSRMSRSGIGNVSLSRNANLPTVTDPKLYAVRCKPGQERLLIVRLMNRYLAEKGNLQILSAVSPGTKGYIYIEAFSEGAVRKALAGLRDVFQRLTLIPLKQMTSVMTVTASQAKVILKEGMFARLRKFPYKGDLCQIMKVLHGDNKVVIKVVPRIDYEMLNLEDEELINQRKAMKIIPQQELLRPDRVRTEKGVKSSIGEWIDYVPLLDSYFSEGLLVEDISSRLLDIKNVNPTVTELRAFKAFEDAKVMSMVNKTKQKNEDSGHGFVVGDSIRVTAGELKGVSGKIIEIKKRYKTSMKADRGEDENDFIEDDLGEEKEEEKSGSETVIKVKPHNEEIKSEILEFSPEQIQKLFVIGNHVKLMNGDNLGETGVIVEIAQDNGTAFIFSDVSKKEIVAKLNDLKLSNETSGGRDSLLDYKMYDFVRLAMGGIGVIVNIGDDTLTILDSSQRVTTVSVNAVVGKISLNARRQTGFSARDKMNNYVKINDKVKILGGKYKGLEGTVRFISKNVLFLFCRQILENAGMLSTFSKSVSLIGGSAAKQISLDRGSTGRGGSARGRGEGRYFKRRQNDSLKGKSVKITAGKYKGYVGIVVDIRDSNVKVELHTKNRSVTVDRSRVRVLGQRGKESDFDNSRNSVSFEHRERQEASAINAPATPLYGNYEEKEQETADFATIQTPGVAIPTPAPASMSIKTPAIHLQGSQPKTPGLTLQSKTPGLTLQNPSSVATPGLTLQAKTPGITLQGSLKTPGLTLQSSLKTPGLAVGSTTSRADKYKLGDDIVVLSGKRKGQKGKVQTCDGDEVIVNMASDGDIAIFKLSEVRSN